MSKRFDMELFLASVLTGSHATRKRHLRQAAFIQSEITKALAASKSLGLAAEAFGMVSRILSHRSQ